jgi:HEAT repeat protein
VIAASKSDDDLLRAESAFALGVLDDPQALERLDAMLDDPHPDARFNAATGLARHGKPAALPVLLEMVDPDQTLALKEETGAENRKQKRIIVNVNGLHGIQELAKTDLTADLSKAEAAVEQLTNSDLPEVRENALRVRDALAQRSVETK